MEITHYRIAHEEQATVDNPMIDEDMRQQARTEGKAAAGAWLTDEVVKIHQERMEKFVQLLNHFNGKLIDDIQKAIAKGYIAGIDLSNRMTGQMSRAMGYMIDELSDRRSELHARDGISVACAMYNDVREQAIIEFFSSTRNLLTQARDKAMVIESETAASQLLRMRTRG